MSPITELIGGAKAYGWGSFNLLYAFESIVSTSPNGSTGTVTFSNIPQTYRHLQIRIMARNSQASNGVTGPLMTLNSSTSTNNHFMRVGGDGYNITSDSTFSTNYISVPGCIAYSGTTANVYGAAIIDIYDYTSSSINKTVRAFSGTSTNSATTTFQVNVTTNVTASTSAINSISFYDPTGTNYNSNSVFALYGIRGTE